MVEIGDELHRDTRACITDMSQPLGLAIGNNLEVIEAINTLNGKGPADFVELCLDGAAIMLMQAGIVKTKEEGEALAKEKIDNGEALEKLCQMVKAQGGDDSYIRHPEKFEVSKNIIEVKATNKGYIKEIYALEIGEAAMRLGAGRATIEDVIDPKAGILLNKKVSDYVNIGDTLCVVHTDIDDYDDIIEDIKKSYKLSDVEVKKNPIIYEIIHK